MVRIAQRQETECWICNGTSQVEVNDDRKSVGFFFCLLRNNEMAPHNQVGCQSHSTDFTSTLHLPAGISLLGSFTTLVYNMLLTKIYKTIIDKITGFSNQNGNVTADSPV